MRRSILALSLTVFVLAPGIFASPRSATASAAAASASSSAGSRYRFPGGGQILFQTADVDAFLGIVDSDGTLRTFMLGRPAFAYWDPAGEDQLLVLPLSDNSATRVVRVQGDRLTPVGSWPTPEGPFTFPSLDGRFLASWIFGQNGHLQPGAVVVDRSTGRSWTLGSKTLVLRSWTPDGRIIAAAWQPHGQAELWDPITGATTPFPVGWNLDLTSLSWTCGARKLDFVMPLARNTRG